MPAPDLPKHGFAQAVFYLFKDKMIEINCGETSLQNNFSDFNIVQKSLIRGVLKQVIGDALIVHCVVKNTIKKVAVNCWTILTITEFNPQGGTKDIYYDEGLRLFRK